MATRYHPRVLPSHDLSRRLRAVADANKRAWWERYLKGAIPFYGVPMAAIRRTVHEWVAAHGLEGEALRQAAFDLLRMPVAEEKLAGISVLQEVLLPAGMLDVARDLDVIATAFDEGAIADWNTTDWLCIRVLGPWIEAGGDDAAARIAGWVGAPGLWRRRAGVVSFVPLAARGDAAMPRLVDTVVQVCEATVQDQERFAQTAIGWVLRELSDVAPDRVFAFLMAHEETLSREAVRMAAARLSEEQRAALGIRGKRRRR